MTRTKLCTPLNQNHRSFVRKFRSWSWRLQLVNRHHRRGKHPSSFAREVTGRTPPLPILPGNPSSRHLGWFQHSPVIDCRRTRVKILWGTAISRETGLVRRRNLETLRNGRYIRTRGAWAEKREKSLMSDGEFWRVSPTSDAYNFSHSHGSLHQKFLFFPPSFYVDPFIHATKW